MGILGDVFQNRDNPVDDVVCFEIRNDIFELPVGDASNLGLNIVEVFGVVRQEHFELFLSHSCPQLFDLRNQFIANPPRKLIRDDIEVALQSSWRFLL